MRILIIGEFSGFAKNLDEGFRSLKHDSFVFSWGDGFKNISQDKNLSYIVNVGRLDNTGLWGLIKFEIKSLLAAIRLRRYVNNMSKQKKWDAALILNPSFIKRKNAFWQAKFTKGMIMSLLNTPSQIYMSACGGDFPFFDYWKDHLWKDIHIIATDNPNYYSEKEKAHFEDCMSFINKVIPVMYGYAQAWRNSDYCRNCRILQTIPLPINTSKIEVYNNICEKVVVFHGIIRPLEKGTSFIMEAMERLQTRYPDLVKCIAKGGMPLNEYLPLLNKTNILIDQTYADSAGMNALYALAMGKVVLGGNEADNQKEFREFDCPIINIGPNADQIYRELEELILNRDRIKELSIKSRQYVERVHDSKVIAQKYIEVFKQYQF